VWKLSMSSMGRPQLKWLDKLLKRQVFITIDVGMPQHSWRHGEHPPPPTHTHTHTCACPSNPQNPAHALYHPPEAARQTNQTPSSHHLSCQHTVAQHAACWPFATAPQLLQLVTSAALHLPPSNQPHLQQLDKLLK
jgi:hypothetical protein